MALLFVNETKYLAAIFFFHAIFVAPGGCKLLMRNWPLFLLLICFSVCSTANEPRWVPALADGAAAQCPDHPGTRNLRSEIIGADRVTAFIVSTGIRSSRGCTFAVRLRIRNDGQAAWVSLADTQKVEFSIIDFSPDRKSLLLQKGNIYQILGGASEHTEVTTLPVVSGEIHWHDVWNLFGWQNCDATVNSQGFTADGRIVIFARPSIQSRHLLPNCVPEPGLYATDSQWSRMTRLPDDTLIERYGKELHPRFWACKSDPDIVGKCFNVHGRLFFSNGTPGIRLWGIGTHRTLGIHTEVLPEALNSRMDWNTYAYGDFLVCPFTKQRPEEMQMVCVESASKVVYKKTN